MKTESEGQIPERGSHVGWTWCLEGRGCEGSGVGEGSGALAWAAGEIVGQPQRQVFGER